VRAPADPGRLRLPPRGFHAKIEGLVARLGTVERLLVCALAAWMSLCCCEKRMLAHAISPEPAVTAHSGCCSSCCEGASRPDGAGSDSSSGSPNDHAGESCCRDGCCQKAAVSAVSFSVGVDLIGSPLPPVEAPREAIEPGRLEIAHDDLSTGEPPPRLALVITRRLRI